MSLVVAVAAHPIPSLASGTGRRLLGLLDAMVPELGPRESVVVFHQPTFRVPPDAPSANSPNIRWRTTALPGAPAWRRSLAERRTLVEMLLACSADVVDLGVLPVPPNLPCPAVVTVHDIRDLDGWSRRPLVPRALLRAVTARSLQRAARVVVPSKFTAQRLAAHRLCRQEAVEIVRGGVSMPPPHRLAATPATAEAPPRVLHVGHLEPRKRIDLLVRSLAQLSRNDVILELVGTDHSRTARALRRLADSLGVSDRVRFRGVQTDHEVQAQYASAAVVAIPSAYEGFGLTALEALAHGATTLIAKGSALEEVAAPAATLVDSSNVKDWVAAIESGIRSVTPADTATPASRRQFAARFGWQEPARQLLEIWRAVSAQRS